TASTRNGPLTACRSWPTPSKRPGATTSTSSPTAASQGSMCGAVGSWICWSERNEAVTEADWVGCTDPKRMLKYLRGKINHRKRRLHAVACCQRIRSLMADERSIRAVEVAEAFADGLAPERLRKEAAEEAKAARNAARGSAGENHYSTAFSAAYAAVLA